MKTNKIYLFFLFFISILLISSEQFAEGIKKEKNSLRKIEGSPARTYLNINNVSTLIYNNGNSDIDPSGNSGAIFPKGSGKGAVFESGLLWGAKIEGDPQVRVGGSAYRQGLQPGKILPNGSPEDPELDKNRIYRIRPDIYPGGPFVDLSAEAIDEGTSADAIRAQYEKDWNEWPVADGAEFDDVDGDGNYNPSVDIPGVPGADQTIWFVANDLDPGITTYLYGAQPLGIEMQATFWAYAQTGALGNMFFRKYKIINKSNTDFQDMYVSMWSDVDLGNSSDDFAGCDTTLSLGYCYNAQANDATYSPLPPPAVGFDFFQGPVLDGIAGEDRNKNGVDDAVDFGIFKGKVVGPGKINLPMTAFYYFARGDATVVDPTQGDPQGSTQFYNFFQGKVGLTGDPFVDPNTLQPTTFVLPGDPQARTGWIDGQILPGGDRRIGSASGPFTMAIGDTQEVVVAEIFAGAIEGVDRISAIGLLKFYDQQAQLAYDNFFNLPVPPKVPEVAVIEADKKITLNWGKNLDRVNETESTDDKGFSFQGYNVYQLPSTSADVSAGVRIATFDIADGTGKIKDDVFDTNTGEVVNVPVQFGNDTGIRRYLDITTDALKGGTPLINGIRYYFAVTSYSYNSGNVVPNNLENPLQVLTVIPNDANPGDIIPTESGDISAGLQESGSGDAVVQYKVIDPTSLTGDKYEVFFDEQAFFRDDIGWHPVIEKKTLNKPTDLTGSSLIPTAVWGENATIDLHYSLDLVAVDYDYSDGVQITFPAGLTINSAESVEGGHDIVNPVIEGQVVTWGSPDTTEDGEFSGGETFSVNVDQFALPMSADFTIWDDGWATGYGDPYDTLGNGIVHAEGIATVESIENDFVTQDHWNLRNVSTGEILIEDQTIYGGVDIYADVKGPGGSAGPLGANAGDDAVPIVDGILVSVSGSFAAPLTISQSNPPTVNGEAVLSYSGPDVWWTGDNFTICDFTRFGYADGLASTSFPLYGGAGGTTVIERLQKDIELRWTGVLTETVINGNTLTITESGGSMATIFGASGYDLANHPLNPNPGTEQSISVRVPFEVWNVDDDEQVNVAFWDRSGDPTVDGGAVWNQENRVYAWVVNTPYSPDLIDVTSQAVADNATWNLAIYLSTFTVGDVVRLNYDNPIQKGIDKFTFTTPAPSYSVEKAKDDIKKVNVFPNPYYAVNSEEINKYNRFVTFSHLPDEAIIRIFNISGVHVRTIEKESNSQFQRWDLANESGLPVSSGLYIAYIEMPGIGKTKILKVAIIQEQQILDRF